MSPEREVDPELSLDTRLFDKEHFNSGGRLVVTAEEFSIPTSIFGELRSYAVEEHVRKRRAAKTLESFYAEKKNKRKQKEVYLETDKTIEPRGTFFLDEEKAKIKINRSIDKRVRRDRHGKNSQMYLSLNSFLAGALQKVDR